jgi:voltage-gated potassium channel
MDTDARQLDDERQQRFENFEAKAEMPMLVLATLLVPIVLMPLVEDLSPMSLFALEVIGVIIWAGFVVEYAILWYLAPRKWEMVRTHKLDLALAILPLLRPLRMARILRLVRAGSAGARALIAIRRLARRPGFGTVGGVVAATILIGGTFTTIAEHNQPDSTIDGFGDGLWWAFVTCTTVGYGDEVPITLSGRVTAVTLMLTGISALSILTANVATMFIAGEADKDTDQLTEHLDRIERQISALRQEIATDRDQADVSEPC